jgi:cytochrome c oxidase cbb3-type subunit 3
MTTSHGIFIVVLTLANIAGALWLLWWTRRDRAGAAAPGETTGHVWDEDLRELNNPLPRWWLWLFIVSVAFGGGYLVLYPGLGTWEGTLGWSSRAEHDAQRLANAARIERALGKYAPRSIGELAHHPAALSVGRNLFLNNCATCHGSDGGGAPGFPDLTDKDWLWGGDPDTVAKTIAEGRMGMMPPWKQALGDRGVEEVLDYVFSLQGRSSTPDTTKVGGEKFAMFCAGCHGADARGNPQLGTPNLTDDVWLHGGSPVAVRASIANGRGGTMPPHAARLGETRIKLLAAYVLSLGEPLDVEVASAEARRAAGNAR